MAVQLAKAVAVAGHWPSLTYCQLFILVSEVQLSVVVPILNESLLLEAFLNNTLACMPEKAEIILVDGGSSDNSLQLLESFCSSNSSVQYLKSAKGRAVQMNTGASIAKGQYLLFLHVDTHLPNNFSDMFNQWRQSNPAWGFARVRLQGDELWCRIISTSINFRSRITSGAGGDQAQIVKADTFKQIGGYREIDLMEDIDLSYRLRRRYKLSLLPFSVVTSSRRWRKHGVLKTVILMWFLRLSFLLGVPPSRLALFYSNHF